MTSIINETNTGTKIFTNFDVKGNTNIIQGNLNVNGNLNVDNWSVIKQLDMYNNAYFHGKTNHYGPIRASNQQDSSVSNLHTASFVCNGGATIMKNLIVAGDIHLLSNITISSNLVVASNTIIEDKLIIHNEDDSISTQSGSGIFRGGLGITKNINIGYNAIIGSPLSETFFGVDELSIKDAKQSLESASTLQVSGPGFIKGDLFVGKNINIIGNLSVHGSFTKLLTENIVADDPLIVLGANSTKEHDNNPSGFVSKYGKLNLQNQFVHKFTGLVRMPYNNIQHNLWIQMNKPYNLIENINNNSLAISDEPDLKDKFNNYINFDNNQLSDLNVKNLSTHGHINIKGNLNIESTGFLKLPVGNSNNRPKGINFINNTDEIYNLNHPYRNINGLLRFNMDTTLDNNKNGILEIYYIKEGKRWDGKDFYHSDTYNSNNILHKGLAGWRKIGPYRLDNLDSSTRIEVENPSLINDQVISFYTSNKLRMSIFPDKSFNNNTSYHKLAVDNSVLEGSISMGQIKNTNYNIKGVKLTNSDNTRYRLNYSDNISKFANSLTLNHIINSDKITNVNNSNSFGLQLEIQIINGNIENIYATESGEGYNENDILVLNLDNTILIPNFLNITLISNDLLILDKGFYTHIGFNKPMSTLDISGNLNVSNNITTGDYFGLNSNKIISLSNEIQNGSSNKPWRNYITCDYKSPNNIINIIETKNNINKNFKIKIIPNNYTLTTLLDILQNLLNVNTLYNYNYIVNLIDNKVNISIDNLTSDNKSTFLFSKSNSHSYSIFGFELDDYVITDNNPIISKYNIYDNDLFEIYENDILNNNVQIIINDKKAIINIENHNIKLNSYFNIVPQFENYFIFDGTNYIKIPDNLGLINKKIFTLHFNINLADIRFYNNSTIYYQGSNNTFINIYINQNNKIVIKFDKNNSYISTNSIITNTWTHISINLNITILKILINEIEDSVHNLHNNILNNVVDLNTNYFIGSNNYEDNFTGYINNLVFYNNKQDNIESHNMILNNNNVIFNFNSESIFNINGIIKDNVINNNSFDIIINNNNKFDVNSNIYINEQIIDFDSINDKYIILDNINSNIIYNINNIIKQNNNTGKIISLNKGSNIVLTIDSSKNTFTQTIKGNNWILNTYLIEDNNNELDVIPGFFNVHVSNVKTTETMINIQSELEHYRIGEQIILNDIRNGNGAIFNFNIVNNNITSITLINGGNNYVENDILTISKNNINGISVNNKSSQDVKITLFNNNIISGVINSISIDNIIQHTQESLNQTVNNVNSTTFKGNDIIYNIVPTITQIQHGYNYGNIGDVIIIEDINPPTIIKKKTNLIDIITNNDFIASSNITHITQDVDIILNTGDTNYDLIRNINDKSKFQIKTNNEGNIIEIIALKGNNYKVGDILYINNIPGNDTNLIIEFNNNSIITYPAASFKVNIIDTTHTNTEIYNSDLSGYLIKSKITLQGGNPIHPIIIELNMNNISEVSDNNWIPNYYNISDNNNINYNIIVDKNNNNNETFVYLRNDSTLNSYTIGNNIILEDNRNGTGVEFNIEILNNMITNININNSGNNYMNNDIITISKNDIPGTNFGKSLQDIIIKVFSNNIVLGKINNISLKNIIQHPQNAFNTTELLLITNSIITNGTNVTLEINGSYNEIIGNNWLPNKTYKYTDDGGAAFNINVDNNGNAITSIDFITNSDGINSYLNNQSIIIPDLTPIINSDKIFIYVTNGNFNTYDVIKYKNDDDIFIDIGIPNLIYYKEITIKTNIKYTFIKNTSINQIYTYLNPNNRKLYLNNKIKFNKLNKILYGDKLLLDNSTENIINYDVNYTINKNCIINTKNNKSYIDFISYNHNLYDNNTINISNKYNINDYLNKDVNIHKESSSSFYYNNITHISNIDTDIKLTFNNVINITYNNTSINDWNDGIYYYIDPNPPTIIRHDINLYNNENNINNLSFDSNETLEYITQSSNIITNGSATNLKFKFIIINSIISSIYCIYSNNVSINELITIEIFNNSISKGTYIINISENNIISNPLQFTINVKSNKPYITSNNLNYCSNYPLNHNINIPKNVCGIYSDTNLIVTINSIPSVNSNINNNNNWSIGTYYFIDKLKETKTIEEDKYIVAPIIYNGNPLLNSYGFNGIDNFVEIPSYYAPQLSNTDFTIEFWANIVALQRYVSYPIFIQSKNNNESGSMCYIYQYDNYIYLDFLGRFFSCGNISYLGQWAHYVFTFDNSSTNHLTAGKIYINGVKQTTTTLYEQQGSNNDDMKITNGTTSSGSIFLGLNSNIYFLGEISHLKIWNIIRNENEIKESCYYNDSFNTNLNNINNDLYYIDTLPNLSLNNLLLYIPFNINNQSLYTLFKHTYYIIPALIEIIVDSNFDIIFNLNNYTCMDYKINDTITITSPLNIVVNDTKAIINFNSPHNLNVNDTIFIYDYFNPLNINNYFLLISIFSVIIEDANTISFNVDSSNVESKTYTNYQIFKTIENNKVFNNNIITNFIQNSIHNNNIIKYYKYIPGTEIIKVRSNGIIQLSTNSENNNTTVNNNNKGSLIHLLSKNNTSKIFLESTKSLNNDSIQLTSHKGGIHIDSNKNIDNQCSNYNIDSSTINFNTNTDINNIINIINHKGEDNNSLLLKSTFGNINLVNNKLININASNLLLKSQENILTLSLNTNINVKKYDIIKQFNNDDLEAIVYEDTNTNLLKVISNKEFNISNSNLIIINNIIQQVYVNSISDNGHEDSIIIETSQSNNFTKNNDIITLRNYMGIKSSIQNPINPYNLVLPNNIRPLSSIKFVSNKGSILLDSKEDWIDIVGSKVAISSSSNSNRSVNIFTNSNGNKESINITNYNGTSDNVNNVSAIEIISKNGGTKLEVHKNNQILIQSKHYDNNGNIASESTGQHGYINIISNGLSDDGPNVPLNINSSGAINITSTNTTSLYTKQKMFITSLDTINIKSTHNTNVESNNILNILSKGTNDIGSNVAFNLSSSGGINIKSLKSTHINSNEEVNIESLNKTHIHSNNTDLIDSFIHSSKGGILIDSEKRIELRSQGKIILNTPQEIEMPRLNITGTQQSTIGGLGSLRVQGGLYVNKDIVVKENMTILGNFIVEGNRTQINTDTLIVDDPLIIIGSNNNHEDNNYGGVAIKHSNHKININEYNNKLYIDNNIITINSDVYSFSQLITQINTNINNVLSNFNVSLNENNTITIINDNIFTLYYNENNENNENNYNNNILSTLGFINTQRDSKSYTSNKLSYFKYSGFVRKPTNNRFYLIKDQIETIITDDNKDICEPNFVINKNSDLIKTELEVSKIILNDGSINSESTPSEGMIQYNVNNNFNYLNAYIKEYPTNILRNIGLTQYNYFTYQFYFNDLSNNLQWGNRVSGQIDSDIAIFSKTVLNRFAWIGNQNIFIQHIEINVDEFNNNTKRHYQLRIVDDDAIDNRDINDNTGVIMTTTDNVNNSICIDGTNKKKEINVVPINSDLLLYNSNNDNLINNNCLKIIGGIDKYIGLQVRSVINNNSNSNECVIVLRGFTSFY